MDDIAILEELRDWLRKREIKCRENAVQLAEVGDDDYLAWADMEASYKSRADAIDRLLTERAKMVALIPDGPPVTLAKCSIGLFLCDDTLGLKTEYGNNEGRIEAYIVSSGEFFWGDHRQPGKPLTIADQRAQIVTPMQVVAPQPTKATADE